MAILRRMLTIVLAAFVVQSAAFAQAYTPDGSENISIFYGDRWHGMPLSQIMAGALSGPNTPTASTPTGAELIPCVQGGVTSRCTIGQIAAAPQLQAPNAPTTRLYLCGTATRLMDTLGSSNLSFMSQSGHFNRCGAALSQIALVLPEWYVARGTDKTESPLGNAGAQWHASVLYPSTNLQPISFSGGQNRVLQGDFTNLVTDLTTLSTPVPANTQFEVRLWMLGVKTNMAFHSMQQNAAMLDTAIFNASGQSDYTNTNAAWTGTGPGTVDFRPLAILGTISNYPSLCLGDSREDGYGDAPDASGDLGYCGRALGATVPYTTMAQVGDTVAGFLGSDAKRLQMAQFTKNTVSDYGVNDIGGGATLAQLQANLIKLWTLLSATYGQRVWHETIPPDVIDTVVPTAATSSGTTATITLPSAQAAALSVGETIVVAGMTPAGYNGTVTITAISGQNVSYTLPSGGSGLAAATTLGTVSDQYASLAFQSANTNFSTAGNGTREQFNDWLRDGAPILNGAPAATGSSASGTLRAGQSGHPLYGYFEVADQVESARNSGKFKVNGTANYCTADGVHNTQTCVKMGASAISTANFVK